MNKLLLTRSLISAGLLALVGAVGAQTYYTHQLVKQVAERENAAVPADVPAAAPDNALSDSWGPSGDPWAAMHAQIRRMQAEMDRVFQMDFPGLHRMGWPVASGEAAKVNMEEKGKEYLVTARIPGAKESDINVYLDGRLLSISSSTQGSEQRGDGKGGQVAEEHYSRAFQQAFTLPGPVSAGGMHSEFKDGVLTVTIPKAG